MADNAFDRNYPLNLGGGPLTLQIIHQMVYAIVTCGKVSVDNCEIAGPARATELIMMMHSLLTEEDKRWMRSMIRQEIASINKPGVLT